MSAGALIALCALPASNVRTAAGGGCDGLADSPGQLWRASAASTAAHMCGPSRRACAARPVVLCADATRTRSERAARRRLLTVGARVCDRVFTSSVAGAPGCVSGLTRHDKKRKPLRKPLPRILPMP